MAGILVGARQALGPSFAMWVPQRGRVSGPPAAAAGWMGRGVLTLAEGLQREGGAAHHPSPAPPAAAPPPAWWSLPPN
jgi:hypothetical protein